MRKKIACDHNWNKIKVLLENELFNEVIKQLSIVHVLDDLWFLIEAHMGLENYKEPKKLLEDWKYQISNLIQESYFLYYDAKVNINEGLDEKAYFLLNEALEKADDEIIKKKIQQTLVELSKMTNNKT